MLLTKRSLQVSRAASTDPTRYPLNGILIEPDGTVIGCDGHILVRYRDPDSYPPTEYPAVEGIDPVDAEPLKPVIMPLDAIKALDKQLPKKARALPVLQSFAIDTAKTNQNGAIYAGVNDLSQASALQFKKVEGQYPDYRRVIPKRKTKHRVGFGIDALSRLLDTLRALDVKYFGLEFTDSEGVNSVRVVTDKGADGVIMPARFFTEPLKQGKAKPEQPAQTEQNEKPGEAPRESSPANDSL